MKFLNIAISLALICFGTSICADEPVAPQHKIELFNGKDLSGWSTWLKATGEKDPEKVFSVEDGVIHIQGGEHRGYIATKQTYKDFHLSLEYKWGKQTDGGKYVRNSGVLLNAVGPPGNASGVWMTSLEVQLAQGCEGDFIVIRGKDDNGDSVKATITCDTRMETDKRTRWQIGGEPTEYSGRQFWWSKHDPEFQELLDTRGRWDVASPVGEWTRVECICEGDRVTVKINGEAVNECYKVFPAAGKILLQNEGHEVYFRNVVLNPLNANGEQTNGKQDR